LDERAHILGHFVTGRVTHIAAQRPVVGGDTGVGLRATIDVISARAVGCADIAVDRLDDRAAVPFEVRFAGVFSVDAGLGRAAVRAGLRARHFSVSAFGGLHNGAAVPVGHTVRGLLGTESGHRAVIRANGSWARSFVSGAVRRSHSPSVAFGLIDAESLSRVSGVGVLADVLGERVAPAAGVGSIDWTAVAVECHLGAWSVGGHASRSLAAARVVVDTLLLVIGAGHVAGGHAPSVTGGHRLVLGGDAVVRVRGF